MNEAADARPSTDAWRRAARRWSPLNFAGRIGRTELLVYLLAWHAVVGFGASLAFLVLVAPLLAFAEGSALANAAVFGFVALAAAVYGLGVASFGVRRLHDLGRSGRWMLLAPVPLVNLALGAALLVAPGTAGENAHGTRNPLGPMALRLASVAGTDVAGTGVAGTGISGVGVSAEDEAAAFAAGRAYAERLAGRASPGERG